MPDVDFLKGELEKYGQAHLLAFYDELSPEEQRGLVGQIENIDFAKVLKLYREASEGDRDFRDVKASRGNEIPCGGDPADEPVLEPMECTVKKEIGPDRAALYNKIGERILENGLFAAVTMAGGQGTRLGHDGPKGTYDIGLPSHASLFEIQCERLLRASRRFGAAIPWYIMTSRENDGDTRAFFREHGFFGYDAGQIHFFVQNMLPMVDFEGRIVLDSKGHVKEGADGHGGIFAALESSGCFDDMKRRGIKWVFVGGIDNVLLKICDPFFIGFAESSNAPAAAKSLLKRSADEGVGVFCRRNGRPYVIEYTEISKEMAGMRDDKGEFVYGEAHILCNIFSLEGIQRIIDEGGGLPYHAARKKTKYVAENGETVMPEKPNAYKFEAFIFDAFEKLEDLAILRVDRETEFAPVKNREGEDSPESARRMYEACKGASEY
ncbi:MAG: UDPGP type 1 family protein [Clostridia bacterium]|nr:UDPGP type 1 family protein [Clostridia bacterium]